MPKIYEHAKNIPEGWGKAKSFIGNVCNILETMFVSATSPIVLCM